MGIDHHPPQRLRSQGICLPLYQRSLSDRVNREGPSLGIPMPSITYRILDIDDVGNTQTDIEGVESSDRTKSWLRIRLTYYVVSLGSMLLLI